jgi:ABC-type proline/glycine betaine transport system substrate-binding protein
MGELVYKSDVEGVPTEQVAEQWIEQNEAVWKPWLE